MGEVRISFIIPVYNGENYLPACLESVIGQSFSDLEILVVNDGSTDGTEKILEEYASRDGRIRVFSQENQGVSAARNAGILLAKGKYLYFFDSDDVLHPRAAERMYEAAEKARADIVLANYHYFQQYRQKRERPVRWLEDAVFRGEKRLACAHLNCIPSNKLWKREVIEKNGLSFPPLRLGEDLCFFLQFLASGSCVATIGFDALEYRIYEGSSSQSYSMKALDYIRAFQLMKEFYGERPGMEEFRRELKHDELFYYVGTLKRLPRYEKKQERMQLMEAFLEAGRLATDGSLEERPDIRKLQKELRRFRRFRGLYTSDFYAGVYRAGRHLKHRLKRGIGRKENREEAHGGSSS